MENPLRSCGEINQLLHHRCLGFHRPPHTRLLLSVTDLIPAWPVSFVTGEDGPAN